jgi:6,7-dimethyl-8-ribityllumazine synthase
MNQRHPDDTRPADRIAFVQSCWHKEIVDQCRKTFVSHLSTLGFPEDHLEFFEVPGAF